MDKPMVAKIAGIITLIQLGMSFLVGLIGGLGGESTGEVNGGYMVLTMILVSMVIMIIASIFLIRGNKSGRLLYFIGTMTTLAGNVIVAGAGRGIVSSFIPLLFMVLLYTVKSSREYYKKIN